MRALLILAILGAGVAFSPAAAAASEVTGAVLVHRPDDSRWNSKLLLHTRDVRPRTDRVVVAAEGATDFVRARPRLATGGRIWKVTPATARGRALVKALRKGIRSGEGARGNTAAGPKGMPIPVSSFTLTEFNELAPVRSAAPTTSRFGSPRQAILTSSFPVLGSARP
jgi:hypothetical protein